MFLNSSKHDSTIANIAVCSSFASALFVALCWPRVRSVRRREQPSSCLSPWLGWHSGCGTDGRQLHLSGFLYLLFRNQWLHYHRPVQLHSLAVSWAVCSVCLSACLSFSWAVSNWILASTLIIHCAAFAMSSAFIYPFFYHDVHLQSACFCWVHALTHLDLWPSV